jgi:Ca2+-transporting ATPase
VTFHQLTHWTECPTWEGFTASPWSAFSETRSFSNACDYFGPFGKAKASTLSLSVLVCIEMMNALNALSEDGSLVRMPPWVNPYLLVAMAFSMAVHCLILYVPAFARIFQIVPLSGQEWALVLLLSAPVVLIDEVLKFFGRRIAAHELRVRKVASKTH